MTNPIIPKDLMKNISFFLASTLLLSSSLAWNMQSQKPLTARTKKQLEELVLAQIKRNNKLELEQSIAKFELYKNKHENPENKKFQQEQIEKLVATLTALGVIPVLKLKIEEEQAPHAAVVQPRAEEQVDFAAVIIAPSQKEELVENTSEKPEILEMVTSKRSSWMCTIS